MTRPPMFAFAALSVLLIGPARISVAPTGPAHLVDAVYAQGYAGTSRAPSALAPYVTWAANVSPANLAPVHAAGMLAYTYTNFMVEYANGSSPMWNWLQANQQYVATTCTGAKISVTSHGGGQQVDPAYPAVYNEWRSITNAGYDAVFVDDTVGPSYFASGAPCDLANWTQSEINGTNSVENPPYIFNALGALPLDTRAIALIRGNPTSIGFLEGCYATAGGFGVINGLVPQSAWLDMENDELAMVNSGHAFWCYSTDTNSNATSQTARIFVLASFLLTFSPSSVIQEAFATPNDGLNPVQPEYAVIPSQPLVAQPSSISGIAAGGIYYREYAACSLDNQAVGACAMIVNPDSNPHANPLYGKYGHSLALSGGGVFDGGSATFSGPPGPFMLGANSALVAAR